MARQIDQLMEAVCSTVPQWQHIPAFDSDLEVFSGIQAITYDGPHWENRKTTTFAYLGIPEGASEEHPVPAVVLVHGGGGQAYLPWVKLWNDRGYAAIAMSTRGYFPAGKNAGSRLPGAPGYQHGMYGEFLRDGFTDSPDEDGMKNADLPLEHRWITHAIAKVILAHNVLRTLPQIDNSKIGITGISWGGVVTSLVITHDPRFAFAVPVYGSGYLDQALTYMHDRFSAPGNAEHFRAEDRFGEVSMPVLWLAWNDDNNFTVTSNSLSYLATAPNNPKTCLALVHNMMHDHPYGWKPPIIGCFADWAVKNGKPLVTFLTQPSGKDARATLNIPDGTGPITATLYWLDAPMTYSLHDKYNIGIANVTYMDQVWQTSPATLCGNQLSAQLPANACGYYLEIRYMLDGQEIVTTSVYTTI